MGAPVLDVIMTKRHHPCTRVQVNGCGVQDEWLTDGRYRIPSGRFRLVFRALQKHCEVLVTDMENLVKLVLRGQFKAVTDAAKQRVICEHSERSYTVVQGVQTNENEMRFSLPLYRIGDFTLERLPVRPVCWRAYQGPLVCAVGLSTNTIKQTAKQCSQGCVGSHAHCRLKHGVHACGGVLDGW